MTDKDLNIIRHFVSTVYIFDKEKVLLTWNDKVKSFIPIGGHVEENELPCECVKREAKEETGFDIELFGEEVGKEFASISGAKRISLPQNFKIGLDIIKPEHHHINLVYIGKVIGGELLEKTDEGEELKWFSLEEANASNEIIGNVKEEIKHVFEVIENLLGGTKI
jgi:ADP-ribose pyrophosphatase YjhB (NUDIX family)